MFISVTALKLSGYRTGRDRHTDTRTQPCIVKDTKHKFVSVLTFFHLLVIYDSNEVYLITKNKLINIVFDI